MKKLFLILVSLVMISQHAEAGVLDFQVGDVLSKTDVIRRDKFIDYRATLRKFQNSLQKGQYEKTDAFKARVQIVLDNLDKQPELAPAIIQSMSQGLEYDADTEKFSMDGVACGIVIQKDASGTRVSYVIPSFDPWPGVTKFSCPLDKAKRLDTNISPYLIFQPALFEDEKTKVLTFFSEETIGDSQMINLHGRILGVYIVGNKTGEILHKILPADVPTTLNK